MVKGLIDYRMPPQLPPGTKFKVPKGGDKKYVACIPGHKPVYFGNRNYEHYKDSVPKRLGGGKWSHLDHGDPKRRKSFQARHRGIKLKNGKSACTKKYTACWFSYNFLW